MAKKKQWKESELRVTFNLERIVGIQTPLMKEWLDISMPDFDVFEQHTFDDVYSLGVKNMLNWGEEDLKMKFLSKIVPLGNMIDEGHIVTFFDKPLKGVINDISLSVKLPSVTITDKNFIFKSSSPQLSIFFTPKL